MNNEWIDPARAEEYANKHQQIDWYESEVNMPSLLSLMPDNVKFVLDVGSGPGEFTAKLAEVYVVEGADVSLPLIKIAERTYPHLSFRQWDGQSPYSGNTKFDVIFSKLTVHFIQDLHKFALFSHQILNREGSMVLSVRHPITSMPEVGGNYLQTALYTGSSNKYGPHAPMIHRSFEEYVQPFVENGFVLTGLIEPRISSKQAKTHDVPEKDLYISKRLNLRFRRI